MKAERKVSALVRWRRTYRGGYDAVAMVLYIALVYVWAVGVGPLGRDFALMAEPERLSGLKRLIWESELRTFGAHETAYLFFNLVLLYACMLLVYRLTNRAIRGPWWLGTLSALFFMANPVHSEAVLNLSGSMDLLPAMLGLGALVAYAELAAAPSNAKLLLAFGLFVVAVLESPFNAGLILVLMLWEWLIVESPNRSGTRLIVFFIVALSGIAKYWLLFGFADYRFAHVFSPLYFVFYPLGFLPESAQRFHAYPALGWLAGATVVVIVAAIYWKARKPAILFGILAMLVIRVYPGLRAVDPVHLIGGGQLLLPNVFFNIALVAMFFRMMDHPRWRLPVVSGTTLMVAICFCLMIRSELAWQVASKEVRAFQAQAVKAAVAGETLGVLPDYWYYRTAPVCLSKSIEYDTPFSVHVPHESLLTWNRPEGKDGLAGMTVVSRSERQAVLSIDGKTLLEAAPWQIDRALLLEKVDGSAKKFELPITAESGKLPARTLPLRLPDSK